MTKLVLTLIFAVILGWLSLPANTSSRAAEVQAASAKSLSQATLPADAITAGPASHGWIANRINSNQSRGSELASLLVLGTGLLVFSNVALKRIRQR